jgi:hypothetical protein
LDQNSETSFRIELNAGYAEFNHLGILKLKGAGRNHIMKNNESIGEFYFIVSELAPNGDLFGFLSSA